MNSTRSRFPGWLALGVTAATLWLGGCAADKAKPAPLETVTAQIAGKQVWQLNIGNVSFPLNVAARQGQFFAASDAGTVVAVDAATGREAWRADVGARLSAGVGSDGRYAAVVTRDGEVVVLDKGTQVWRARVDSRVVTAPLVAGERVFVMGVDRVVHAFDVLDGRRLWTLKRPGDALTLAQAGVLTAYKDTLVAGQGNRLVGIDPLKGTVRWEVPVVTPRGSNEVERLADLVGPVTRAGSVLCMRAFQNALGCVDAERGQLKWSVNGGGLQAVGGDADFVFSADASDRLSGRRRSTGEVLWTTERFLNRGLSGPVSLGKTLVVGDFEGEVHFLGRDAGQTQLRLPTDGSAVVGTPVVLDTTLLVVTAKGGLFAFRPE